LLLRASVEREFFSVHCCTGSAGAGGASRQH